MYVWALHVGARFLLFWDSAGAGVFACPSPCCGHSGKHTGQPLRLRLTMLCFVPTVYRISVLPLFFCSIYNILL